MTAKDKLDAQQAQVAAHREGHALVIAGPGSGKTHTVVERSVGMIQGGVYPKHIMMMTFTNKAAKEMRMRFLRRLDESGLPPDAPTITTFHAFGSRLITKNPEACGRGHSPSLMDDDDQGKLLKESLRGTLPAAQVKRAAEVYELARNLGLSAGWAGDEERLRILLKEGVGVAWEGGAWDGLCAYESAKKARNTLDFHDLIILPIHGMESNLELRERVRRYSSDMTIDEAQDTNLAQYRLIKLLVPPGEEGAGRTLILVGDEDQAIHCWRGANPENLRLFEADYAPSVYRLENNYRSLPDIVKHSNAVIRNNTDRYEKSGRPVRVGAVQSVAAPVGLSVHATGDDMARHIARLVANSVAGGTCPSQIAILYRTHKVAEILEASLLTEKVPYRVFRGTALMERAECKMLGAAIRLAVNPMDWAAFERLSVLIAGMGKRRIAEAMAAAKPSDSVYDLMGWMEQRWNDKGTQNMDEFLAGIYQLYMDGPTHLLQWAESPEMRKWLSSQASAAASRNGEEDRPEGFDAWAKISKGLALDDAERAMLATSDEQKCAKWQDRLNYSLKQSVARMKFVCDCIAERLAAMPSGAEPEDQWDEAMGIAAAPPDDEGGKKKPRVNLMTCHSAKGLEFQDVHVAGWSDGLMPLKAKTEGGAEVVGDMEEERRLAYVAMTRAKNRLFLHHAEGLLLSNGKGWVCMPQSRFGTEAGINRLNTVYHPPLPPRTATPALPPQALPPLPPNAATHDQSHRGHENNPQKTNSCASYEMALLGLS